MTDIVAKESLNGIKCSTSVKRVFNATHTHINITLQHPVALRRSDFTFCFYAVYTYL
jgi:hypothetical protein